MQNVIAMDLYQFTHLNGENQLKNVEEHHFEDEYKLRDFVGENMEALFGLRVVKLEFKMKNKKIGTDGRADTLCFYEEARAFVLIEYKKTSIYEGDNKWNMENQGKKYRELLLSGEGELACTKAYQAEFGEIIPPDVQWDKTKVLFVFPYFPNPHKDKVLSFEDDMEYWEIRRFNDGTIVLNCLNPWEKKLRQGQKSKGHAKNEEKREEPPPEKKPPQGQKSRGQAKNEEKSRRATTREEATAGAKRQGVTKNY